MLGGSSIGEYVAFGLLLFVIGSLGVVVSIRGKTNAHRAFAGFVIFITAWMASNFFENEAHFGHEVRALLLEVDFATALLSGYFFWIFSRNFPASRTFRPLRELLFVLPLVIFASLSFTPFIAEKVMFEGEAIGFKEGALFLPYGITLAGYFFAGLVVLFRKFLKATGVERQQINFVLIGFSISVVIGLAVNLLLQNLLTVSQFRLGLYGLIFIVGGMAYAIIKHHLFDIKIIAAEALAFLLSAVLLFQVFLADSPFRLGFSIAIFVLVFFLLIAFLRSVILEVRRREQIELLAANLKAANDQLAALNEMKSNFVSIASHQLRAPIGGVRGYLLLMREGDYGKLGAKIGKVIDQCTDQLDHLLHVVNMFLDVTKMEAGKLVLERQATDLRELATSAAKDNELGVRNKGLTLTLALPRSAVTLAVDGPKLRDVMYNFIENAVKYTTKGTIKVSVAVVGDMAEFRVKDSGMGIPEEEVPKLFAKFVRAGGGFRVAHGSGLGLYIAKTITEAHGGEVFVESAGEGQGSTFGCRLPLRKAPKRRRG